ncbi:hypothetical protein V9L16_14895 [Pseudomonas tolaasii]|uniref:hypothetical protein n=1 Tax=Pseudomonas tolaasii TaxID=29442 RepID=UPI0030D2AA2F
MSSITSALTPNALKARNQVAQIGRIAAGVAVDNQWQARYLAHLFNQPDAPLQQVQLNIRQPLYR